MSSLADILGQEGYETLFFHAGHEGSLYLHDMLELQVIKKFFPFKFKQNKRKL